VRELQASPGWPAGLGLSEPGDAAERLGNLSRAYRVNLTVLALIALFTGAFLVFSVLALSVAKAWAIPAGVEQPVLAAVALAVFLGHLWPVFHGFRGGKGVATAAGVFFAIDPLLGLGALATWCLMLFFFRISSLSALVTALFAPLWFWLLFGLQPMLLAVMLIAALLLWRHRANIGRLLRGEEKRVGNR
jgi:glycerol-3-phosphate acyltransferase PlsY